jgi:HD-like signal output (HDOD) protein
MSALPTPDRDAAQTARSRLFARLAGQRDLPTLGAAVTRTVQLASSDREPLQALANFVLSDMALTQRVLRLANSVCYRPANDAPVTTVSKAILLMGFETVRTCALAMLLIERLDNREQAQRLKHELAQSMVASVIARRLARETLFVPDEEAAIAALFRNLGRVLIASCDHSLLAAIESDTVRLGISESEAAMRHIGCGLEDVSRHMLSEWNMPEEVCAAIAPVQDVPAKPTEDLALWMQLCTHFSADLAGQLPTLAAREAAGEGLQLSGAVRAYLPALALTPARLKALIKHTQAESQVLCRGLGLSADTFTRPVLKVVAAAAEPGAVATAADMPQAAADPQPNRPDPRFDANAALDLAEQEAAEGEAVAQEAPAYEAERGAEYEERERASERAAEAEGQESLIDDLRMQSGLPTVLEAAGREPSGKPTNARELLLAAMQDAVQSVVAGQGSLSDMAMIVLEALIRALGFRFATLFLRDAATGTYRARLALGDIPPSGLEPLHFRAGRDTGTPARDLFDLALERDVDLVISDGYEPKILSRLPSWHRAVLPASRSFVVLPLIYKGRPLGLFYADRLVPAPEGLTTEESSLLRTLKNQVLARLNAPAAPDRTGKAGRG